VETAIARAGRVARALGALFAESRLPVIAVDREGRFITANGAAVAQYGWSLDELVTMRIQDIQAGTRDIVPDLGRAYEGDADPLERRPHHRRNGSVLWVVPTAGPITIEGETFIVSVLKDVTAILDAEQRARDATEASLRDRQLVLNAVLAMLGEIELAPALRILARSFAQAIGRSTTVWLPEKKGGHTLYPVAWHDVTPDGLLTIHTKRIDLDRERFSRLAWDTSVGYAVHAEDVAEGTLEHATVSRLGTGVVAPLLGREGPHGLLMGIPRAGEDLSRAVTLATTLGTFGGLVLEAVQLEARAEIMWQAASEQLSDGIVLLDSNLRVVRINSAERRLLDFRGADVVGRTCAEVFQTCEEVERCPHRIALEERKRQVVEIVGHVSRRPLRIEVIPAAENDGNVAIIHVAHDLSEERAVRSQLVSTERLASIGRLAAGVAHEINNPAAFVTVNLGVMRDRFLAGTARAQEVLPMLEDSLAGMDRIREIVRDLKGLARDRSIDIVDLGAIAQSALRMAAHETRGRGKIERVAEDGAIARVRGARIAQVVLNLVLNAAQALPAGRAENRIVVRTRREADRALIEVADNGPGIDPAILPQIFEPFFTTREGTGGTGLGLWLARSIVEEEGGTLTFQEEPDGGACFVVDLPAAALDAAVREQTERGARL
jgi:PAS domain S-box-containing protein